MEKINAIITGIGGYVPDYILTNQELSRMVDTTDEWIQTRVGIKERRILTEEGLGTSYMARKAASQLLEKTGADPDSIDALIVATTTPDYKFPSTASIVVGRLGMHNAFAMDTAAACSGFLYTLDLACSMIESGRYKRIIVIGADKMSSMVDYTDRNTCVLFGDGAGAVLVEGTTEEGVGMQGSYLRTDGKGLPFLHLKAGGSVCPPSQFTVSHKLHYIYQEGRTVFRYAVTEMSNDVGMMMSRFGLTPAASSRPWPSARRYRSIRSSSTSTATAIRRQQRFRWPCGTTRSCSRRATTSSSRPSQPDLPMERPTASGPTTATR